MLFCDLNDREFEITVMKKFNEIQVNSERQFSEFENKNSQGNKRKMTVTYKKNSAWHHISQQKPDGQEESRMIYLKY